MKKGMFIILLICCSLIAASCGTGQKHVADNKPDIVNSQSTPQSEDRKLFTKKKLMTGTKSGEVTRLKDIGEYSQQFVYSLAPYQASVSKECPQADKINQHLRSINYIGDEWHWSLVFVDEQKITVVSFKRSAKLDFGNSTLKSREGLQMPAKFEPSSWAEAEQTAFYRLAIDDRQYLIFGRDR